MHSVPLLIWFYDEARHRALKYHALGVRLTYLSNFSLSHAKRKTSRAFPILKHKKGKTEKILLFLVELCADSANFLD